MADTLTPEARSERMGRIRSKDTKPEMTVRRLVHGMGYRYRLHDRRLPGTPDIVFRRRRKVILIHGCFWHRHPDPNCKLARLPKGRLDFWQPKLDANQARDLKATAALAAGGWEQLVVWECQCGRTDELKDKIRAFLEGEREN